MREMAREIPGTPVLYLHFRSPALEKPSDSSVAAADMAVHSRQILSMLHIPFLKAISKYFVNYVRLFIEICILFYRVRGLDGAMERLQRLKEVELDVPSAEKRIKRRKAKGPNPLSCKKKKTIKNINSNGSTSGGSKNTEGEPMKKKRKRVKIAKHIRQELALKQQQTSH